MARLYANENFPLPVVQALQELGHDVVTVKDRGEANRAASDLEVLAFAVAEDRAVLTLNRFDFIGIHQSNPEHAGIVVCSVERNFAGQAERIHEVLQASRDLKGRLVRINRPPG